MQFPHKILYIDIIYQQAFEMMMQQHDSIFTNLLWSVFYVEHWPQQVCESASHSVGKSSVSYCSNQAHHRHHMVDRWDHTYPNQNSPCGILSNFEVKPKSSKYQSKIFANAVFTVTHHWFGRGMSWNKCWEHTVYSLWPLRLLKRKA